MKTPAPADLQRWSDEVAHDPTSLAFLPLARAYRRMGQRAAALQLCLRGLQHYPSHVEAHALLALLYLEDEQRERAADEWSIVLRLDPDNFEALRGLGFCYLEQDQLSRARHTLERATLLRPTDTAVQEALRLLGKRQEHQERNAAEAEVAALESEGQLESAEWGSTDGTHRTAAGQGARTGSAAATVFPPAAPSPEGPTLLDLGPDPTQLFAGLGSPGALHGALLLDAHGLVLAGSLDGAADAAVLGAILGGAIGEAMRTVSHLALGEWRGILLESQQAVVHLAPVGDGATVLLAARRDAPTGWVLRVAEQARELSSRYLEAYP